MQSACLRIHELLQGRDLSDTNALLKEEIHLGGQTARLRPKVGRADRLAAIGQHLGEDSDDDQQAKQCDDQIGDHQAAAETCQH